MSPKDQGAKSLVPIALLEGGGAQWEDFKSLGHQFKGDLESLVPSSLCHFLAIAKPITGPKQQGQPPIC
jgi:hypothetical protein